MARKNDLQVALLLDLSDFAPGLKKAKDDSKAAAGVIGTTLDSLAANIATRVVTMESALKLAEKGVKEFIKTSQELEKAGEGNEGTAAVVRVTSALDMLGKELTKAITQTDTFKVAAGLLADSLELATSALDGWDSALLSADAAMSGMSGQFAVYLADIIEQFEKAGGAVKGVVSGISSALGGSAAQDAGGQSLSEGLRASGRFTIDQAAGQINALREAQEARRKAQAAAREERDDAKAMRDLGGPRLRMPDLGDPLGPARDIIGDDREARANAARYSTARGSVVDAFVNSWQSGLSRLGDLFHGFSADVSKSLGGMSQTTTKALGDTFESAAFLGPQLERVYGQSAKGAARFQAAQLALVGALAVVKAAMASAEAVDLLSTDPGAAAAKLAAAVGYAGAAALAGYSAAQTLAGQPGGAQGGGFATSEQLGQERRQVTVVIQSAVGGEEFVRREVMPAINRAVRADAVLLSTNAQSAGSLQPGRY